MTSECNTCFCVGAPVFSCGECKSYKQCIDCICRQPCEITEVVDLATDGAVERPCLLLKCPQCRRVASPASAIFLHDVPIVPLRHLANTAMSEFMSADEVTVEVGKAVHIFARKALELFGYQRIISPFVNGIARDARFFAYLQQIRTLARAATTNQTTREQLQTAVSELLTDLGRLCSTADLSEAAAGTDVQDKPRVDHLSRPNLIDAIKEYMTTARRRSEADIEAMTQSLVVLHEAKRICSTHIQKMNTIAETRSAQGAVRTDIEQGLELIRTRYQQSFGEFAAMFPLGDLAE